MSEAQGLPILIIGGGISGLTAAAAFAQKGIKVTLIERKPELADEGGVGLTLVANAMRALNEIGVAADCVDQGMPADSIAMRSADGTLMADNPLPRIGGPDWPGGTGISRSAFHSILAKAALAAGVDVRCGLTVADYSDEDDAINVTFSDGSKGKFALMVGADGLYSDTRRRLFPESVPLPTLQSVWRADCDRPAGLNGSQLYFGGKHGVVGICPISKDRAYLYIVEHAPDPIRRDEKMLHLQMREELAGYGGYPAEIASQMDDPAKVNYRPLEWLLAPMPWSKGRVILIGDAAHANPPVLAQGAAMGIEDAIVLAEEYSADQNVQAALSRFIARRYDRTKYIVEASCQLAKWEVEHTPNVDVAAVMRESSIRLAEPI